MVNLESSLIESFLLINRFFQNHSFRYCLIGGIAAGFWGKPRYTQDMDFTIATQEKNFKTIIKALEGENFKVIEKGPSQIQVIGNQKLKFQADLILAEVEYQEWVIQRAKTVEIFNTPVPICSPEDLIILKLIANRRQDLLDIEIILAINEPILDKAYLKKWFSFWELTERFKEEFGKDFPQFI